MVPAGRGGSFHRLRRRGVGWELLGGLGGSEVSFPPLCFFSVYWLGSAGAEGGGGAPARSPAVGLSPAVVWEGSQGSGGV